MKGNKKYQTKLNKAGRSRKMSSINDPIVRKLAEAFKMDFTVEEACIYAGIAKDTYYRWLKENEGFSDEMERSKLFVTMSARKTVMKAVDGGCVKTSKWLLEKRDIRYSKREHSSVNSYEPLTPEEKEELNHALKMAGLV